MLNNYFQSSGRRKEEGEKPFWISFADLMSALMVMFLLVMSVALLAVTNQVSETDRKKAEREQEIEQFMTQIDEIAQKHPGMLVDKNRAVIDFGDRARFETSSSQLSPEQAQYLTEFVAEMLVLTQEDVSQKWLKRVVAEGFSDQRGDYLFNLNLSLQRSQRVLCVLLAPSGKQAFQLNPEQQETVRQLFLVGGYSFNSARETLDESRRIELRLEFYGLNELHPDTSNLPNGNFGTCRI